MLSLMKLKSMMNLNCDHRAERFGGRNATGHGASWGEGTERGVTWRFKSPRQTAGARGSMLLLVVVVLVLIALLGLAYLQQIKIDRFATARHERSYIDIAINSILQDVRNQLHDDVWDNIAAGEPLYDYPWTSKTASRSVTNGDGDPEPVAGSKTNRDDFWLASTAPIPLNTSMDSPDDAKWLHLTNLEGIWLTLPSIGSNEQTPVETPIPVGDGNVTTGDTDTNVPIGTGAGGLASQPAGYETLGADADGDGVLDSRWQWVPPGGRDLGGRRYVMALRIVDLNSMLNVNTATALTNNGTDFLATDYTKQPRGYTPVGVDLSRLLERAANALGYGNEWKGSGAQGSGDLSNLFYYRFNGTSFSPDPTPSPADFPVFPWNIRDSIWKHQASLYGNTLNRYLATSELELRYNGGLNNMLSIAPVEDASMGMQYTLRNDPNLGGPPPAAGYGTEAAWNSIYGVDNKLYNYFYGGKLTDAVNVRKFPAIRQMLTAMSGTATYSPKYSKFGTGGRIKYDLNHEGEKLNKGTLPRNTFYGEVWKRIFLAFTKPSLDPPLTPSNEAYWYLAGTFGSAPTAGDESQLAMEYTLGIEDYIDKDGIPTGQDFSGVTYYGMEMLPFLREAYIQTGYHDGATKNDGQWVDVPDTQAMAIEIGNPFDKPIEVAGSGGSTTDPRIRIVVKQGGSSVSTYELPKLTILPRVAKNADDATEQLIVYSNEKDTAFSEGGKGDQLPGTDGLNFTATGLSATPNAKGQTQDAGDGTLTFNSDGQAITIELQVNVPTTPAGGGPPADHWVTYDRIPQMGTTISGFNMPATVNLQGGVTSPTATTAYMQKSVKRAGQYVRYLTHKDETLVARDENHNAADGTTKWPDDGGYVDQWVDSLQTDKKTSNQPNGNTALTTPTVIQGGTLGAVADELPTTTTGPGLDYFEIPVANEPMRSIAELGWVMMFGFTDQSNSADSDFIYRLDMFPKERRFLYIGRDFTKDPIPVGNPAAGGIPIVPHAAMLLDQFTTVGVNDDGIDNDNDDGDNKADTSKTPKAGATEASIDNKAEQFVPGTINVNTATLPVLTLGAPLPDPNTSSTIDNAEALMRTIIAYRSAPQRQTDTWNSTATPYTDYQIRSDILKIGNATMAPYRNTPGIASLGELLYLNPVLAGGTGTQGQFDMQEFGYNSNDESTTPMDLYPAPEELKANGGTQQAVAPPSQDNQEEKLARFQFLSQAFTVRSDRFVVYGVVRGYPANAFNSGPVEQARFIAIIGRGSMVSSQDQPHVIAFLRLQ